MIDYCAELRSEHRLLSDTNARYANQNERLRVKIIEYEKWAQQAILLEQWKFKHDQIHDEY